MFWTWCKRIRGASLLFALAVAGACTNVPASGSGPAAAPTSSSSPIAQIAPTGQGWRVSARKVSVGPAALAEREIQSLLPSSREGWSPIVVSFAIENAEDRWRIYGNRCGSVGLIDSEGFEHAASALGLGNRECFTLFPPRSTMWFDVVGQVPSARALSGFKLAAPGGGGSDFLTGPLVEDPSRAAAFDPRNIEHKPLPMTLECPRLARYTLNSVEETEPGRILLNLSITNLGGQNFRVNERPQGNSDAFNLDLLALSSSGAHSFLALKRDFSAAYPRGRRERET